MHCAGTPLNNGNTKGQAFGLFVPNGCTGPLGPACPLLLYDCVCCVIQCDTKTSLSSSLCQPAALHWKPALTAMTLQPDWTAVPSNPSHKDGAQRHHFYTQTSELLYDTPAWAKAFLLGFCLFFFFRVHSALNELQ